MTLAVIGAGFGRTGTFTLKLALEQLGFGPCCHGLEPRHFRQGAGFWRRIFNNEPIEWDEFFRGYRSTVDSPSCRLSLQLARQYPQARIVLTVRDSHEWYESYSATVLPMVEGFEDGNFTRFLFGPHNDRDSIIAAYERHNAEIRDSIPPDRLLVYDVADGWPLLCRFLGVPVPAAPFPRANLRSEFPALVDKVLAREL